jgi:hypothetical protein
VIYARTILLLVCFFGMLAACRCNATVPEPKPVIVSIGDAEMPIETIVCANMLAFCPTSVPDGGLTACEGVVSSRYGLTPATMPTVLTCEAQAPDKTTFVRCGGVASCP